MVASVSLLDRTTPASSSHSNAIRADAASVAKLSTASNTIGTASRSRTLQPVSSTRTLDLAAASEQAQTKAIARFLVITPPQIVPVNHCGPPLKLAVFYARGRPKTRERIETLRGSIAFPGRPITNRPQVANQVANLP